MAAPGERGYTCPIKHDGGNGYVPVGDDVDELTSRYTQLYIANGTVGMLREWVNEDFPLSSQEIAEIMYTLSRRVSQY